MNVLITGGSGFIGAKLVKMLKASGHSLTLVGRRQPVTSCGDAFIEADLLDPQWIDYLPMTPFDAAISLAQSRAYRDFPNGNPDVIGVNITAVEALARWCLRSGTGRLIHASTGSVDDQTASGSMSPRDFYSASKVAAEALLSAFCDRLSVQIIRPYTVYGPGQSGMLIPNLINRIRTNTPIHLAQGSGPKLSPTHVHDVCRGIERILSEGALAPSIVKFAGPVPVTVREISEILAHALNREPHFEENDDPVSNTYATDTVLQHLLGENLITPAIGLTETVKSDNVST